MVIAPERQVMKRKSTPLGQREGVQHATTRASSKPSRQSALCGASNKALETRPAKRAGREQVA